MRKKIKKIVKWIVEDAPNYSDYEEETDAILKLFKEIVEEAEKAGDQYGTLYELLKG